MKLPDFVIGGAQKCGTTTLHHHLRMHPRIYIPRRPQELHFFDLDENFARGVEWYSRHFAQAREVHEAVGQTSPLYLYEPNAAVRLAKVLPDVRLIFVLRKPLERAYSHYWHEVKKGRETLSFEEAIAAESWRLARDSAYRRAFSYVDRGRYAGQVRTYRSLFSDDQILILRTEELAEDLPGTLDRISAFLEIEEFGAGIVKKMSTQRFNASRIPRSLKVQRAIAPLRRKLPLLARLVDRVNLKLARYPSMSDEMKQHLQDMFASEIKELEEVTGESFAAWLSA